LRFLKIEDLHLKLGDFFLRGVFLDLQRKDYLAVIGPTGAGKTLLLESIIGFWKPDKGRIYLEGKDITDELPEKRRIGIVYQDYALLPHFTVYENIAYGLKKKEKQKEHIHEKVNRMAAALQIDHLLRRTPTTLSGGEQQRVALARALIVEPRLLLMDEPLSALDPQTRREARSLLRKTLSKSNTTVIHITHDLDDAWALANKVAIFKDGKLLQFGPLQEVFHCPASRFVADFVGATMLEGTVEERKEGVTIINVDGFSLASLDDSLPGESVGIAIRPENIVVCKSIPKDISAQNVIRAKVEEILSEGTTCVLCLKTNHTVFSVFVANNAVERLDLKQNDTVYAVIKASNVRIV
jgi:molybdate transport system ATP-binding protein